MMQYVYIMAVYTIFCFAAANAYAGGEMKKVCHEDAKTKKEVTHLSDTVGVVDITGFSRISLSR